MSVHHNLKVHVAFVGKLSITHTLRPKILKCHFYSLRNVLLSWGAGFLPSEAVFSLLALFLNEVLRKTSINNPKTSDETPSAD